jgi:alkylation response protein AidB-like acyl-CoA dehydrogenase
VDTSASTDPMHTGSNTPGPMTTGTGEPASGTPWLERIRSLTSTLTAESAGINAGRELTAATLEAMHRAQLFRMTLPNDMSGGELPVPVLAQATELVASADASAGWCLGQGLGCAMSSAFLDTDAALEVFGPANAVLAWGAGVQGRATATDGGYLVSGTWRFASGGKHATYLGAHCKTFEADGTQRVAASGQGAVLTGLIPREQVTIHDDWHVMGLKGTRSEGYTAEEIFVPDRLTLDREDPAQCRQRGTLYKFPTTAVYASMFSGVALGIAGSMLADLIALASGKTVRGGRTSMRESPVIHTRLAELTAELESARAFQRQTITQVWDAVDAGQPLTLDQRVRIRLATTYAITRATDVSEQVYRLAGSTAVFENEPFEQRFRDAHAVSQQVQGRHTNFESVGRHLLGLDVETTFL